MPYRIRHAREDDLPLLPRIEEEADARFLPAGLPEEFDAPAHALADLAEALREARLWVAADGEDRPVGFALAVLVDGLPHLEQVSVLTAHGRRGLGRRLVEAVLAWARERGAAAVTLTTFRDVAWNAPFYERLGFRPLDDAALGPGMRRVLAHEAAQGLPPARRVAMRLSLAP
jgi:GNAT superfamily N-acetyltransferase